MRRVTGGLEHKTESKIWVKVRLFTWPLAVMETLVLETVYVLVNLTLKSTL